MENNEEKKSIIIKQGTGDDELEMTILVTQEELDKMEQIRQYSPENWKGKDLELLQEARKIIGEKPIVDRMPEEKSAEHSSSEIGREAQKHNNSGLWWALGILCFLFIGTKVFTHIVNEKTKETISAYTQRNTTMHFSYQDLTFDYPGNWSFSGYELSDDMYSVVGVNEKKCEFGIMWTNNPDADAMVFIDNIITGYMTSDQFDDVEYSSAYEINYNGHKALEADYSYMYKGERCYSKVIAFVVDGKTVILNPITRSEKELNADAFQIIGKTIEFKGNK